MEHIVNPEAVIRSERLGFFWEVEYIPGPYSRSLGLRREKELTHNVLLDEGERNLLDDYFRGQNAPPTFFLGLHSGDIAETATLANITEPTQAGYGRKQLARSTAGWPTLALDAGDFQVTGATVTFESNFTSWLKVNRIFLASQQTGSVGSVLLEAPLTITRELASQDTLQITPRIKAQ